MKTNTVLVAGGIAFVVIVVAVQAVKGWGQVSESEQFWGNIKPGAPTPAVTRAAVVERPDPNVQRALLLAAAVRASANDPRSIELIQAFYVDDGTVAMRYRGRNAFNALIINAAVLTPEGKAVSGSEREVAALWNKRVAGKPTTDVTSVVRYYLASQ